MLRCKAVCEGKPSTAGIFATLRCSATPRLLPGLDLVRSDNVVARKPSSDMFPLPNNALSSVPPWEGRKTHAYLDRWDSGRDRDVHLGRHCPHGHAARAGGFSPARQ